MSENHTPIGQYKTTTPTGEPHTSTSQQDPTDAQIQQTSNNSVKNQYAIRPAKASDLIYLNAIETSAGQLFRTVGFDAIADDDPLPIAVLESYLKAGNLWVAIHDARQGSDRSFKDHVGENDVNSEVVGFLAAFPISIPNNRDLNGAENGDGKVQRYPTRSSSRNEILLHIAELSVSSAHQRQGLGKGFLNSLEQYIHTANSSDADDRKPRIAGISLTTYTHLAFNGAFYRSQGFQDVPVDLIIGRRRVLGDRAAELWEEEQSKIEVGRELRCWMVRWCSGG